MVMRATHAQGAAVPAQGKLSWSNVDPTPLPWRGDFVTIAVGPGNEASNGGLESVNTCLNFEVHYSWACKWSGQPTSRRRLLPRQPDLISLSPGWVCAVRKGLSCCVTTQWRPPRMTFDTIWAAVLVLIHAGSIDGRSYSIANQARVDHLRVPRSRGPRVLVYLIAI